MPKAILVVDDEAAIRDMLGLALERAGMRPLLAPDAAQARALIADRPPDLVLLDWMLPGLSGLAFARALRAEPATALIPIIMLSARGEELDRVSGFDAGVDDYVVKPFSLRELIGRIKAVLRRAHGQDIHGALVSGALRMDLLAHRVYVADTTLELSPTEYRLLEFFMRRPERVFSRAQLLDGVWHSAIDIEERTVDVHIRRLRKLLQPHGLAQMIQTVHSAGYRFSAQ